MNVILVVLLVYPLWGIPVHLIFNFFLTRKLLRSHAPLAAWAIALGVNVLLFAPLVIQAQSFFGDIYVPWYLSLMLTPPSPVFSMSGLMTVVLLSTAGSAIWILSSKQARTTS